MENGINVSEFKRKSYFNVFTYHFRFLFAGLGFWVMALYQCLYHDYSSAFFTSILSLIGIIVSIIVFISVPKRVLLTEKGIGLDDDLYKWEDIQKVGYRLLLPHLRPVIEITLKDANDFSISVTSFTEHERLVRELIGASRILGKLRFK